jgi:TonB family protein
MTFHEFITIKEVIFNGKMAKYFFGINFNKAGMMSIKKALILSLGLHLIGLLGGELFLKRARLKNKKIIYPIRLIEIAESSSKPIPAKKKPKRSSPLVKKPKPKVVKKKISKKPQEPKKGIPIKKEAKKEKEQKKVNKSDIKKDEEKKVSKAIEEIKKALALKEKAEYSEISKKFIERQLQIYAAEIYSQIKRNWSIPEAFSKDMGDFEAIVIIRLNPNGELADVRLEKTSGFHPFDESILRAIKKAAPFPAPPLDLKEDELEIEIGFYSNEMG